MTLATMDRAQRQQRIDELRTAYDQFRGRGLALDMTRGKPCPEQLDLSLGLLDCLGRDYKAADGTDCRNYGGVDGLPEAKKLFAEFLVCDTVQKTLGQDLGQRPVLKDAPLAEGLQDLSTHDIVAPDIPDMIAKRATVIQRFADSAQ